MAKMANRLVSRALQAYILRTIKYIPIPARILDKIFDSFNLRPLLHNALNRYRYLTDSDIRSRNAAFNKQGAPDGLPLPPPQLVHLVIGINDIERFYHKSAESAQCIKSILERNGLCINSFDSILDFGCGCGRIMRHWNTLSGPKLYGSDYNPRLIKWCEKSLTFAEFKLNQSASRLDYEDDKFDFIYAISVFTHLDKNLQVFWISELTRVLKHGGYLLITILGTTGLHKRAPRLTPKQRQEFESGQLILVNEKYSGTNMCGAFHPEQYVSQHLAKGLTIVDFIPAFRNSDQDAFLLRKPLKT